MSSISRKIVVGISGSSSPIYGIRLLQALREAGEIEIRLVLTDAARQTIALETEWKPDEVLKLGHVTYSNRNLAASISSNSFNTDGMIIAPCSMHSLAEVAHSISSNLITRAADVHRALILMVRETPLNLCHLRNMVLAAEMGAIILPPIPAFYHHPKSIEDLINNSVGKALDLLSIPHQLFRRWQSP